MKPSEPFDLQSSLTNTPVDSLDSYHSKSSFKDFSEFTNSDNYTSVPESWLVIITDIKGSTKAIESGRYQDVNMIGAASISVLQELLKQDFPYVFGGDGATIVIPSSYANDVFFALCGLRTLAKNEFNMQLRVGCVSVKEIYDSGGTIEFAKNELSSSKCIAMFRGGGLIIAEDLIKGNEDKYEIPFQNAPPSSLNGLTCNWKELPNKRGQMLSLLVISNNENSSVYPDFLSFLDSTFNGNFNEANPVNTEQLALKSMSDIIQSNLRSNRLFSIDLLINVFQSFVVKLSTWFHIPTFGTHKSGRFGEYVPTMRTHADYRKFDDVLRMVLDCSEHQIQEIEKYLESRYKDGQLLYGTHRSNTALMTCYVRDIEPGQHIHFIDGGNGGYAMAAKQLKGQINIVN